MAARPGTKNYGAYTVKLHLFAHPVGRFPVSPGNFFPPPRVDSAVIRLTVRETPPCEVKDEKLLFRLIRAGFGQRRKTLLNSLTAAGFTKDTLAAALTAAHLSPTARAEELTLPQFAALADALTDA
jgi:16S rRNA (adenine1518-N6/adenine1519-N6)-dimethyltransferase